MTIVNDHDIPLTPEEEEELPLDTEIYGADEDYDTDLYEPDYEAMLADRFDEDYEIERAQNAYERYYLGWD